MIAQDVGRIEKAREERRKQLVRWDEYERDYQNNTSHKKRKKVSKNVEFRSDIVFLEAASRGDISEVKRLIKSGIDPDVTNADGLTALHQSCIDNNIEMCKLLLENNANVNAKDNELWTPLHAAATCGNKEICGILINWGADLLALNVDGNMPYDLCEDDDTLILVESEMAKRHVTQQQIDEIRLGPEKEMLNDLKRRYAAGDDLQAFDSQGAAPIHIAAACGYVEVTRYLLQIHMDPEQPDQDGWLPIHIAVSWGYLEIVELLVSYGADMGAITKSGQTVFMICNSKELQIRLKEVWDRREELRKAVKQNNALQSFTRGGESFRSKRNSSILRTSMRDKHRLTREAEVKEKQLAEQVKAKLAKEDAEENGSTEKTVSTLPNIQPPTTTSVAAGAATAVGSPRQALQMASDHRSPPKANGHAPPPNSSGGPTVTTVPPRPPRTSRPKGNGRVTSPKTASNEPNSPVSTGDTASSIETHSESSDSQANYVRPMQRTSNGQMVPVNSDSARSPPNQRQRSNLQSRDNRSRTPKRSDASSSTGAVNSGSLEPRRSPADSLLRAGPSSHTEGPKITTVAASSPYHSSDTLNMGLDDRHKPFSCCHTM